MAPVLEGVDDEVVFTFLFLVISCVLVAAVYLRSRRINSSSAANSETATARDTDHSTPGFGTQTNSNTEQAHGHAREANGVRSGNAALNPDSGVPGTLNKTIKSSGGDSASSGSGGTDAASYGGSSHASRSNDLTSTANENLSDNTNNSFDSSAGRSSTSLHSTDMGPNTASSHGTSTDPGRMATIRVKYLETARTFTVDVFMKVGELKRLCFPTEVDQGRTVRLIYSGRLLINDGATLSYYGVANNSVIHTQISDVSQSAQSQQGQQQIDDSDIDIGQIFLPLLTIILGGCWYGLISYRNMFSTMSAVILVVLTIGYTVVVYAMIG